MYLLDKKIYLKFQKNKVMLSGPNPRIQISAKCDKNLPNLTTQADSQNLPNLTARKKCGVVWLHLHGEMKKCPVILALCV